MSAKPLPELKSTAHLMLLDPGLYCVSHAADTPMPDPQTGLPAVRLSLAPAPGPFGGRVMICGFNGEGWLAGRDDATLVRVMGGPAQVLVTIYQVASGSADAPKLQVLRLSEPPTAAAPAAPMTSEVLAHFYGRGDVAGSFGDWVGERGSRRWIEGFALRPPAGIMPEDEIEYQAVHGRDWLSPWAEGGQFCGSRGMSLPILGLRVRLRGAAQGQHGLSLSATFVDGSEVGPIPDGGVCEAPSLAALEAFQISLTPKRPVTVPVKGPKRQPVTVPVKRKRGAK